MRIDGLHKEYEVKKEKILLCLVIFSIISLIIIGHIISTGIESSKVLSTYNNTKNISELSELDGDDYIDLFLYDMESRYYRERMFFSIFIFVGVATMFHICFFIKTKLIINNEGIELYSIYSKKPSNIFYWNEIKSIKIGDVITEGSKIPRYGMEIRHIKKSYSEHEQLKEFAPIRRFQNYSNLIKDLEKIAEELNIDIYHMDD